MASPFKVFRKHQKVMLAALTILAMFSFVFLGVISDLLSDRGGAKNPVVVKTSKYGNLRGTDLYFMRQDHQKMLGALSRIHSLALGIDPQSSHKMFENIFGTASDEDLVNTWLKSKRGEEIGMVISNDTINDFIQNISNSKVSARDILAILKQEVITQNRFFDALRETLRAFEVNRLFSVNLAAITPAQRWDYFCQLRKQASVELIPLEVDQFVAQIQDPSDKELKSLFEKYKDKLPRPDSPEPGFRIPHKIDVQYFKADIAKFSEPGKITDDEIQKTYEKNRDYFDQFDKEPAGSLKLEEKGAADTEKKDTTSAGEKSKEQAKEEPAEKQKPADKPAAGQEKSQKEDTGKKSTSVDRSPFRLTAMAEQTDKSAANKPADKSAPEKPAADKPAAEQSKGENQASNQPVKPEKTEKRVLSEKLKEKVRAVVAREKINEIFGKLQQTMEENGKKWRKYEAEKIHQKNAEPPAQLDFEALAKQYDLTAGQTGMITAWEAQKTDVGSSLVQGVVPFTLAAFKSMATYKPDISIDMQGNEYLLWKINETPESAPTFDAVKQQVVQAWKIIQARELARKEAERLAQSARTAGTSLKDAFSGLPQIQVITPPLFTMLTEGSVPRASSRSAVRPSEVEGVPMAGLDFMKAVFNLDEKQIGIAMNAPQNVIYVVQLVGYNPSQEVLWKIFLAEDFSKYASVAGSDIDADRQAWLEALKKSVDLQWEKKPEQQQSESSSDVPYEE